MSMAFWSAIKTRASEAQSLADSGEWVQLSELTDLLGNDLSLFFNEKVSNLSPEEQALVKQEGQEIMQTLALIVESASKQKQQTSVEASKMAKGSKGISAYKKT